MAKEEDGTDKKSPSTDTSQQWVRTIMMAITSVGGGDAKKGFDLIGLSPRKRNQRQNRRERESRTDQRPRLRS